MLEPLLDVRSTSEVREGLRASGMGGPHAYIRALDAAADLDIHLDRLVRPLPAGDDLRRIANRGKPDESWILMERLPWDSEFFGRGMARLDAVVRPGMRPDLREDVAVRSKALEAALAQARSGGIDYVFSQVNCDDLSQVRTLSHAGFELIETRCHYHRPLSGPPAERHATRPATADDVPSLARAAREMVNPYDRFHVDPAIPPHDADRMMERWVEASIANGFADVTIVPDVEAPEAFCTAKLHREHWTQWGLRLAQPVLSAVSPRHRGWYVRIISELDEYLREQGAEHSFLITQITNNAVIRCWEKLGYHFGKGEYVFRKVLT